MRCPLTLQVWVLAFAIFSPVAWSETPGDPGPADLLEDLGSDEFAARKAAQEKLVEWAAEALEDRSEVLLDLIETTDDPEIKLRGRAILKDAVMGRLAEEGPGFMGIVMSRIVARANLDGEMVLGVGVDGVQPGTPAFKAELRPGDLLIKVDGMDLSSPEGSQILQQHVTEVGAGNEIILSVVRQGELVEQPLVLMRCPLQVEYQRRHPPRFGGPPLPTEEQLRTEEFEKWLGARLKERSEKPPESGGADLDGAKESHGEPDPEDEVSE